MISIWPVLLASLAYASPIAPRSLAADTLVQDVTNIHNGVLANQKATEAYQGGKLVTSLVESTPVLLTVADIHVVNRKGFVDATLSPQLDESDTERLVQHVVDTVGVSIPSDIQTVISKKDAFEKSGMGSVVLAGLRLLLDDHDTFSEAVLAKGYKDNTTLTAEAVGVVEAIHDAIQSGIIAYSG